MFGKKNKNNYNKMIKKAEKNLAVARGLSTSMTLESSKFINLTNSMLATKR